MKKKYLSLISILLVSLTGCNNTSASSVNDSSNQASTASSQNTSTSLCEEHKFEETIKTPATCTTDGVKILTCSICGYEKEEVIPKLEHNYDEGVITTPATCTQEGVKTYTCSRCEETKTESLPKIAHDYVNPIYVWNEDNSTCTASITCTACQDVYEEVASGDKIVSTTIIKPTCEVEGKKKITAFFDSDLFAEQEKEVTLDALKHSWGTPTYEWNSTHTECVATVICTRDSEHKITEKATITENTIAATCEEDGSTTYKATFTNDLFAEQTVTVAIPQTGHTWNQYDVTKEATCTEKGIKTYTCESCGATKQEEIPMIEHSYGEATYDWASDYSTCTAKRVCSVCQNEVSEIASLENGKVTKEVVKGATCTEDGSDTYTAKFDSALFTSNVKNVITSSIGHNYGEVQRRYLEDSNSIEEYKVCANDSTHEVIVSTNVLVSLDSFNATKDTLHSYDTYVYRTDDYIALSFKTKDGNSWTANERIKVYYDFGTTNYLDITGNRVFDKTMGYIFLTPSNNNVNVHEFYKDSNGKSADVALDTSKMVATFNESLTIASIIIPTNLFSVNIPDTVGFTMGAQLDNIDEYKSNTSKAWGFTRVSKDNTLAGVQLNDCEAGSTAPALSMRVERNSEKVIFTLKNTSKSNWVNADRIYIYLDGSNGKQATSNTYNTDGSNTYIMYHYNASGIPSSRYYRTSNNDTRFNYADHNETIDGTNPFVNYYTVGNETRIILDLSLMDKKLSTSYSTSNLGIAYCTGTSGINRQKNSYGGGDGKTKDSASPKDLSKYQRIDVNGNLVN